MKERDVLTSDAWRVAIDLDTTPYEEIISTIKRDLLFVENQKKEFIHISQLKQNETLLDTLELKLSHSYEVELNLDNREV